VRFFARILRALKIAQTRWMTDPIGSLTPLKFPDASSDYLQLKATHAAAEIWIRGVSGIAWHVGRRLRSA